MSRIVSSLRMLDPEHNSEYVLDLTKRAADEIESLRAREAKLLKVLAHYACKCSPEAYEHCCYGEDSVTCGYLASAALAEQEKK